MARKKNSKALYEVLQEYPGAMAVPDWMKSSSVPPEEPVLDETEPDDAVADDADEISPSAREEDRAELTTEDDQPAREDVDFVPEDGEQTGQTDSRALDELAAEARSEPAEIEPDRDEEPAEPEETEIEVPAQPTDAGPMFAPAVEVQEAEEEAPTVADAEPEWEPAESSEELDEDGQPAAATAEPIEDIQDAEETDEDDEPTAEAPEVTDPEGSTDEQAADVALPGPESADHAPEAVEAGPEPQAEPEPVAEVDDRPETIETNDRLEEIDQPAETGETSEPTAAPQPEVDEAVPAGRGSWPSTAPWRAQPSDEQVLLRLRVVPAMLLLGCVGVLLVAAFVIGRVTAPRPTEPVADGSADENALAETGPQRPPLNLSPAHKPDPPMAATSGQRDPQRYYLIIESLKGKSQEDFGEAERIIEFCQARDIPADMVLLGDRLAIWSLLGFRSDTSDEALRHARQIEDIGKEYFSKYRTYRFLQRKKADGPFSPFFYTGRSESK